MMKHKAEYKEGPEAREKFEAGMRKLFQAQKQQAPAKPKPKRKATSRKTFGKNEG